MSVVVDVSSRCEVNAAAAAAVDTVDTTATAAVSMESLSTLEMMCESVIDENYKKLRKEDKKNGLDKDDTLKISATNELYQFKNNISWNKNKDNNNLFTDVELENNAHAPMTSPSIVHLLQQEDEHSSIPLLTRY